MQLTPYHAKYFSCDLTLKRPADDIGKFTASLQDAQVDLNPHQVDAALFAFKSPLSQGAILADEVGLGKTIEAGIILSQKWAERKRKLLIISPSNLRKQWNQELADKFFLPSTILEAKSFNNCIKSGKQNPFNQEASIVICSYHFAKNKDSYIRSTNWDLVIIDEAHRLRNVYKASNKIGNSIKKALENRHKVLLTATPLQNSILELYGLVSIIDEYLFGDLKSFKSQYSRQLDDHSFSTLRQRLQPICQRTLRRQVLEYINYTERRPLVEEFYPTVEEQQLYDGVSEYLQRPSLHALPVGQRQLMTLILRKLLASSAYAIHGTLDSLINRLEGIINDQGFEDRLSDDFEVLEEVRDEWSGFNEEDEQDEEQITRSTIEIQEIKEELNDLKKFRDLAQRISKHTKAEKLFTALKNGFEKLNELGAHRKALIFTESRRTQEFLFSLLSDPARGFEGKIIVFNGANNDPLSNSIYHDWLLKHKGTDRVTGSPTADKRAALVEYFKEEATIMIATEAAAEGINLQFCSLIINYDLPWNPQRVEQRIGRCHRYGQRHDVVVVNFLNLANAADQRVYELLRDKFQLFSGVFGASDEVLGAIGSGVDFEKRIAKIYQECRDPETIQQAFRDLQTELEPDILNRLTDTKKKLLENVDEEVREKLKMHFEQSKGYLNRFEQKLWAITKYFLQDFATFGDNEYSFRLNRNPFPTENIHSGPYMILRSKEGQKKSEIFVPDDTNIFRVGHPLAQKILANCMGVETLTRKLVFDYTGTETTVSLFESYVGKSGWLRVTKTIVSSFDDEEFLIISNFLDDGEVIDSELSARFFSLDAQVMESVYLPVDQQQRLEEIYFQEKEMIIEKSAVRNRDFFDIEIDKLDQWADDMKISLQKEIEDLDAEIKLKRAEAKKMLNLDAKVKAQRVIKELEKKRSDKRRSLYETQDEIDEKKEVLLIDVEKRLKQKVDSLELFTIKWEMI